MLIKQRLHSSYCPHLIPIAWPGCWEQEEDRELKRPPDAAGGAVVSGQLSLYLANTLPRIQNVLLPWTDPLPWASWWKEGVLH